MKKMKKIGSAVLCTLLFGLVDSFGKYFPPSGPKPGETGKYVYTDGDTSKHCLYCPEDAFESTAKNKLMQEPLCIDKYHDVAKEITPYERENKKIPVCKIGETPGCGPPPEEQETADYEWYCDPGYSGVKYSVYFSCLLIHKRTKVVTWSYYCNESLQWAMDSVDPSAVPTSTKGDSIDFEIVMIFAAVVVSLFVALLATVAYCLCRQRRQNGNETQSSREASVSDCDSTEKTITEEGNKDMSSTERLLPYGEERHEHTVGCQTITHGDVCSRTFHSERNNGSHNDQNNTVRAEFQNSMTSNPLTCQCPAHQPRNPPSEGNGTPHSVMEMKPIDIRNINDLNVEQGTIHCKDSRSQRPNPQGHISNNLCTESGYYDDENDKGHNTEPKQRINERVIDSPECINCEHVRRQQSRHRGANFDSSKHHTAQCISKSSSLVIENELEPGTINHHQEVLDGDESFELDSQQLKLFKFATDVSP
ncbi:uncharacterized protein LOC123557480 isoform X2 [Mercenaria mercenaria]|uniref:uncharacterized protein LOC123557480 isoform X2 n=1 Tax=Mercenaria mercenaria TaxID=6596 RepID=UPI00234F29B1|nr:uncharacterized protein LOC123557480 isoform X2 [Mercenaria mercenaria]